MALISGYRQSRGADTILFVLVLVTLTACAGVGPQVISNGRTTYNEAIISSGNEQMLLGAVHARYGERSSLLAVSGVTANVRVTASASMEIDTRNTSSSTFPLTIGAIYEDNPTISYTPVGSEEYLRALMAPVSLVALAQYTRTQIHPDYILKILISGINGIRNPDFNYPGIAPDPRFDQLIDIMTRLSRANQLHWADGDDQFLLILSQDNALYQDDVLEFLTLTGLQNLEAGAGAIELPVYLSVDARSKGGLGISTRSIVSLIEIFAGAIQVPAADANGAAISFPATGRPGAELQINFTEQRPDGASVAVQYRDGWFSIDETHQPTKAYFRLLAGLWATAMAKDLSGVSNVPVLTVPVSR